MTGPAQATLPQVGMTATVRNRRGLITAVESSQDNRGEGVLHLVTVEYDDFDGPPEDRLIWERESGARLLEPLALPDVGREQPMSGRDFDALLRAARWSSATPFVDPADAAKALPGMPIGAPLYGAVQTEDYQLVPLLKALSMPRIALLLADDVGLGKTVEAGLIIAELIRRRRIRRVLILCPPALRRQWREEMRSKFRLTFDEVDREATHDLRRRLGLDANPWRMFSRVVASYHYLKQPDVLEDFRNASRVREDSPHRPWDLLIVDEAHHAMPTPSGEDSDLCKAVRDIAGLFEHRLFLTATPHNGYTHSFTGLLEILDPVRFTQTERMRDAESRRVEEVLVRRLKREINARPGPKRFADRYVQSLPITFSAEESALAAAFAEFRAAVRRLTSSATGERRAGRFAVEVLGKRLLSSPVAFADSWSRFRLGSAAEPAEVSEVDAAARAAREEVVDDRELESRTAHAAHVVGAWLQPLLPQLQREVAAVDAALKALHLPAADDAPSTARRPKHDARFEALCRLIDKKLRHEGVWRSDERLVVFTEFKTTLDSLEARLRERYGADAPLRLLFGSMDENDREAIKAAFNDPDDNVRVLLATDAASEGLNLQETARLLLHFDVPWNPSRLEQRNGRLDRHGQARDVTAFHFTSDDDADMAFLARIVEKVEQVREDLGATGQVFDEALRRRLIEGETETVFSALVDAPVDAARKAADLSQFRHAPPTGNDLPPDEQRAVVAKSRLDDLCVELDLDAGTLRGVLEAALANASPPGGLEAPDALGRSRLRFPIPPKWAGLIDDELRLSAAAGQGTLPALTFDGQCFLQQVNGRVIFRPRADTALLHLGHPLFQRALAFFARKRFPGSGGSALRPELPTSRWTVRRGTLPADVEALLLISVEEMGVNELREPFHRWTRTYVLPVRAGAVGPPLPHEPAARLRSASAGVAAADDVERARRIWEDAAPEVKRLVQAHRRNLTELARKTLADRLTESLKVERQRFLSREAELSESAEAKRAGFDEQRIREMSEPQLFDSEDILAERRRMIENLQEELARRRRRLDEIKDQLAREKEWTLNRALPRRHALHGEVQVFPVAIEIRLPESRP